MLLLHTGHGAVQLLAKQTSQTHGVKAKRALVIVQCCEEKRFFPVIPCTPGYSCGLRATKQPCCHYPTMWGAGMFLRGQSGGLDVAGDSSPLSFNGHDRTGCSAWAHHVGLGILQKTTRSAPLPRLSDVKPLQKSHRAWC